MPTTGTGAGGPYTTWDLGGCNCGANCNPCNLPKTTIHCAWNWNAGTATGTAALAYQGFDAINLWDWWFSGCVPTGLSGVGQPAGLKFWIYCCGPSSPNGTSYIVQTNNLSNCGGALGSVYSYPGNAGCASPSAGGLTLAAHTCSPLNLHFTDGTLWDLVYTP